MSAMLKTSTACPCNSRQTFASQPCCDEIIAGIRKARTAEELLRARYTAFATGAIEFIGATTHPQALEEYDEAATRLWATTATFTKLEIFESVSDGEDTAYVTFEAHFTQKHEKQIHRERSRFERLNGEWFFHSCDLLKPRTIQYTSPQPGRNQPCPCGSGKKFKKCCAT